MIKPKELRIGNYFYTLVSSGDGSPMMPNTAVYFRVAEISLSGVRHVVATEKESYRFPFHRMTPIKITEDWLQRLGFEREELHVWRKDGVRFDTHYDEVTFFPNKQEFSARYVHELQNFYHFCTGKQLTDVNESKKKITENDIRKKYQKSADYYKKRRKK